MSLIKIYGSGGGSDATLKPITSNLNASTSSRNATLYKRHTSPVDLTKVSKVVFTYDLTAYYGNVDNAYYDTFSADFGVSRLNSGSFDKKVNISVTTAGSKGTSSAGCNVYHKYGSIALDVSALTGLYYIGICSNVYGYTAYGSTSVSIGSNLQGVNFEML